MLEDKNRLYLGLLYRLLKKVSIDNYKDIIKYLKIRLAKKQDKVSSDFVYERIIKKI